MAEKENKKKANPIDMHVGARIRLRRNMIGLSQERLGDALGITFQQVQKYEKGTNRVGASRLQAISAILNAPISFFFEDAPNFDRNNSPGFCEDGSSSFLMEFCKSSEGLQLNRAFSCIENPKVRRRILDLVKALGAEHDETLSVDQPNSFSTLDVKGVNV